MKPRLLFAILFCYISVLAIAQPGILDSDFSADGKLSISFFSNTPDTAFALAVQPDDKILVAGSTSNGSETVGAIARLNSDGSFDGNFGASGKRIIDFPSTLEHISIRAMALQNDGKIVTAGFYSSTLSKSFFVARFKTNGDFDSTFSNYGYKLTSFGNVQDRAFCLAIQADNKIVVGGTSHNSNDNDFAVVRYLPDGTLDSTFSLDGKLTLQPYSGLYPSNDVVTGLSIQSDGKIVAVGYANPTSFGSHNYFALARYNANGTLDTDFDSDGKVLFDLNGTDSEAYCSAILPDGKILIAGNANDSFAVAKLTAAGVVDSSFGKNGIAEHSFASNYSLQQFNALAIQPDDKIIAVGFRYNAGLPGFMVWRLKSNGEADSTFGTHGYRFHGFGVGQQSGMANAVVLQVDGKIVVAGFGDSNPDSELVISRYFSGLTLSIPNNTEAPPIVAVYPNPATDQLNINLGGLQAEQVNIYSIDARLVMKTIQPINNQIDISILGKGVFIAEIKSGYTVQRIRWLKM